MNNFYCYVFFDVYTVFYDTQVFGITVAYIALFRYSMDE